MKRLGYMVHVGCFPTREGAEAKKKVMDQKGVNTYIEDVDALTMRELVTAIMAIDKRLEEIGGALSAMRGQTTQDDAGSEEKPVSVSGEEDPDTRSATNARSELAKKYRIKYEISSMGEYLLSKMDKAGFFTIDEVAQRASCSSASVWRALVANAKTPSIGILIRICMALGIERSELQALIEKDRKESIF